MFTFKIGQTRNDFSIKFSDRNWKTEWEEVMSSQTTGLKINLLDGIVEVSVRQLKSGMVQDVIFHMLTQNGKVTDLIRIRPAKSKKTGAEYAFADGELINHRMDLDYGSKDVIIHQLTFLFNTVTLHSPTNGQPVVHNSGDYNEEDRTQQVLDDLANVEDDSEPPEVVTTNDPREV